MEPAGTLNKEGRARLSVFCTAKLYAQSVFPRLRKHRAKERGGGGGELFVGIR
jgi:hypothetical protein